MFLWSLLLSQGVLAHLTFVWSNISVTEVSKWPVTVAAWSKARKVFARSNTGIVGSNPNQGMDVRVSSVIVLSCVGSGLVTGLIPCPRSPIDCL
jgi:hypothetical protein